MSIDWIPTGPARKIRAKEQGNRGLFPSLKVPHEITEYESCLERDFFLDCNHAPDVVKFQHQPVSIEYYDIEGKKRIYTPDIYIEFHNGKRAILEIKYQSEVIEKSKVYEERWSKAREWCKERGIIFSIITENEIRTFRWYNIWFTLGASKNLINHHHQSILNNTIQDGGERYGDLCFTLAENLAISINKSAQIICHAIYHGSVFVDTFSTEKISNNTIIRKRRNLKKIPFQSLFKELNLDSVETLNGSPIKKDHQINGKQKNLYNNLNIIIPPKYKDIVEKRLKIVKLWIRQPKHLRNSDWRMEFYSKHNISEKSVYTWVNRYSQDGIQGLIPRYSRSGRKLKYTGFLQKLMEKARNKYLNPLATIQNSYEKLEKYCKNNKLNTPTKAAFIKYIYDNTTASELGRKRGRKYYKSNFTASLASFQGAIMPMQIVQMDNTGFDVFPVDSKTRQSLLPPYMTAAIDCYTKMITGMSVSYFPSSSQTVLEVLVQSILPKSDYENQYDSEQDWPIKGFPVVILVDNGMDYRSKQVREFCIKNEIIIEFAPLRTPKYKAFIEQWFKILANAIKNEEVPGFRPLLKQRLENPELKPESKAILTLQELEEWLYKWVLDDYHFTNKYQGYTQAPYLNWKEFRNGKSKVIFPLPREPPKEKFELDILLLSTLDKFKRTLHYSGITWHHLQYNNKSLYNIYKSIGTSEVEFYLNRRDIRWVWVINPLTSKPIQVGLASGWAQSIIKLYGDKPINASAWKEDLKHIKSRINVKITPFLYQKEMSKIKRAKILSSARIQSRSTRKQAEKDIEITNKNVHLKLKSTELKVKSAVDRLEKIKINSDKFKIPQPKGIVIPPRNSNPFAGITMQKAKEMKKKKRY